MRTCRGQASISSTLLTSLQSHEEFFAELKAFIKKHWMVFEANPNFEFEAFLGWCVDEVGARKARAHGHFRNAGVTVEERDDE